MFQVISNICVCVSKTNIIDASQVRSSTFLLRSLCFIMVVVISNISSYLNIKNTVPMIYNKYFYICCFILDYKPGSALVREYFFAGYSYNEIILILFYTHGISIRYVYIYERERERERERETLFYSNYVHVNSQVTCSIRRNVTITLRQTHGITRKRNKTNIPT